MKKRMLYLIILFLILGIYNTVYARYVLNRNFNIKISSAPFYFSTEVTTADIVLRENKAEIGLVLKNNDGNNYNTYDTKYEIKLLEDSDFSIVVEDSNNGVIKGDSVKNNSVKAHMTPIENDVIKLKEDVTLLIKSTYPYAKEINETIIIKRPFVEVGKISGGKSATIDCTKVEGWQNLTEDNFLFDVEQIEVPGEATGILNFTKSYDSNTGILTVSRNGIDGTGTIIFTGNIYARTEAELVESKSGGYVISVDCKNTEDWQNKTVNDFAIDLKSVEIPDYAIGTMIFTKTYNSTQGTLTVNRSSIKGDGFIISFYIDVYSL